MKKHRDTLIAAAAIGATFGIFGTESIYSYIIVTSVFISGLIKVYFKEKERGN